MSEVKWEREYRINGQLYYEAPSVNGLRHGVIRWWYKNGQLEMEIPFVEGKRHGIGKYWYEDGQLFYETHHIHGKEVSRKEYRHYELICQLAGIKDE